MITAEQIRAGSAAVGWSAEQWARESDIVRRMVVAIEGSSGVPLSNAQTLQRSKSAIEATGIDFIRSSDDRPEIRIGPPND